MLEVEAAGDAIHIEQLPHQVQPRHPAALHGGQVHLPKGHPAGGHKFLAEGAAAGHRIAAAAQGLDQPLLLALGQIGPAALRLHALLLQQVLPQAPAELGPGPGIAQLPARLIPPAGRKPGLQLWLGAPTAPIHPQLGAVATGLQCSGGEGGEPQGGRAAEAPVGDQQRPPLAEALHGTPGGRQLQLQVHRVHHHAGQGHQGIGPQGQGEQGGHRRHHPMAQALRQAPAAGVAAGGEHQTIRAQGLAAPQLQGKSTVWIGAGGHQGALAAQHHPRPLGGAAQAGDHGAGAVAAGEQAAVGFLHQLQAVVGKPGHRITGGKAAEGAAQGLAAAGVGAHQVARIPAGVGHVATAPAADQHLAEGLRRALQQQHPPYPRLRGRNGRHEAGGATPRHHQRPVLQLRRHWEATMGPCPIRC